MSPDPTTVVFPPVDDPTGGRLRISPDGTVVAEQQINTTRGDWLVWVRGHNIYYTTRARNPEIAGWPLLCVRDPAELLTAPATDTDTADTAEGDAQ